MSWASIKGLHLAVRLLRQALAGDRVAHAYLFVGPAGVGKRLVALEMAKALNCLSPGPDGDPCDLCASCRKLQGDAPTHPDLLLVEPDGRFIKTDQMRDLQAEMYVRPTEGRSRIAIIDGAERLNPEAGNRVLKLLEEPPPYAVFFLLSTNLSGVLPTLVSRCQIVNFPPLSPDEVAAYLADRLRIGPDQAHLYAALSGGSIGRAMQMSENPEVGRRRDESLAMLMQLPDLDDQGLLAQADVLEKQRDGLDAWLDMLLVWLRDGLVMAQAAPSGLVVNADRLSDVRRMAARYETEGLMVMLEAVMEARTHLMRNANTRLVLDVLLLRLGAAAHLRGSAL